jgi:5-methylthioadenosine/S-adenosylhomocysteine deaminase
MKLASGFAPVSDMLRLGVVVALGTDSAASNNTLSIIKEMHVAALVNKAITNDATVLSAKQALRMATGNAAKALSWHDEIGCLREGMKADLILIGTDSVRYFPKGDPVTGLVYAGNGCDVDTVIVDGKVIMENREIKTLDIERIRYEVDKIWLKIMKR